VVEEVDEALRLPPGEVVVVEARRRHRLLLPPTEARHALDAAFPRVLVALRLDTQSQSAHHVVGVLAQGTEDVTVHRGSRYEGG